MEWKGSNLSFSFSSSFSLFLCKLTRSGTKVEGAKENEARGRMRRGAGQATTPLCYLLCSYPLHLTTLTDIVLWYYIYVVTTNTFGYVLYSTFFLNNKVEVL